MNFKSTLLQTGLVLAGCTLIAATAKADFGGHLGVILGQPLDSDEDTSLELEIGLGYGLESGFYLEALLTSQDWLDSDDDFDSTELELELGYEYELNHQWSSLAGLVFTQPFDSDDENTTELFIGLGFAATEELELGIQFNQQVFHDGTETDDQPSNLELLVDYALPQVDLFASFTLGLKDDDQQELEIGLARELLPQHEISLAFIKDFDDSDDDGAFELVYEYQF